MSENAPSLDWREGLKPRAFKANALRDSVMKQVEDKYFDFNMTRRLEVLKETHRIEIKYSTFRRWCHARQYLVEPPHIE